MSVERSQITPLGRILIVVLLLIPVALLATCFRGQISDAIDDARGTKPPQARDVSPEVPVTPAVGLPPASATVVVVQTPRPTSGPGQGTPRPQTATAPPAPQGTVICAYDAFDPYHKCAYMEAKKLVQGVNFQARGFGLQLPNTSEAQKLKDLSAGKYHVLLTTLDACALHCDANTVVIGLVDASTGADMFVTRAEVNTLNEMAGKAACFVDGSVSEAFFLELFGPLQIVDQIRRVPKETLEEAIA